jgi:3-oxoacyl-[acyl-carrier protein] reductase
MLLKSKNAIIYGAGGAVGSAVARAFAREGARVFLAGDKLASVKSVAEEISNNGGTAEAVEIDALDENSIEKNLGEIVKKAGGIDISFNLIDMQGEIQGTPIVEMSLDDFLQPIQVAMKTHFLTTKAVSKYMVENGSGVILALIASPSRVPFANVGGFGTACSAIESLCRQLSVELGPKGIRVVCLRSTGSPETIKSTGSFQIQAAENKMTPEELVSHLEHLSPLRRLTSFEDIGNVAALMASDMANSMTATTANITCGLYVD